MTQGKSTCVTGAPKTRTARLYSSPACFAQEAESVYLGYLSDGELIGLLNTLLESERAGNKLAQTFLAKSPSAEASTILEAVQRGNARFAAVLMESISNLIEKSLVAMDGVTPNTRYRLLDTTRA